MAVIKFTHTFLYSNIVVVEENQAVLDKETLEIILLKDDTKDIKLLSSIVGCYRREKLFLINFILKYLNTTINNHNRYL